MDIRRFFLGRAVGFIIVLVVVGVFYLGYSFFNSPEISVPDEVIIENEESILIEDNTPPPLPVVVEIPEPAPLPVGTDRFVVYINSTPESLAESLFVGEYITDQNAFVKLIQNKNIKPGAYKISKEMNPSELVRVLEGDVYMSWVVIPPGLRKEEIATLMIKHIGWNKDEVKDFVENATTAKPEFFEGVYAPDTYLIPVGETPENVAKRLISKWNENFAVYLDEFTARNIKWTSALTLASIVQREAASVSDMPLISGILWNRLEQKIALGVDATLQYIRGDVGKGWWAPISVEDKKLDSPYNTYKYKGLPPRPIANPGISAIDAVLNPTETDCVYYIHDHDRVTHCAVTYEEHQMNIDKYLKTK